jgi:adenylate kinase family enzyme
MERVVILGPGGAGKTELAAEMSRRTGLPVVHLDLLFWRQGWKPAPVEEARRDFAEAVAGERWILDGNFLAVEGEDARFSRADAVVFLDLSRATCCWRVLMRLARNRRRPRPDLPEGCAESFDLALLRWIWRYPRTDRPRVLAILAGLNGWADVRRLRSRSAVRRYLATLG